MNENAVELRAYQEAGHAVMSCLIQQGLTDKYVPADRSLILPRFRVVSLAGKSNKWSQTTSSLGSLVTVPQVLIAGVRAVQIKYTGQEAPEAKYLLEQAEDLLAGYIEE
jgi:hypothetical protein